MSVTSTQLTDEEVVALCNAFKEMDADGNGLLDPEEIDVALAKIFPGVAPELNVKLRQIILVTGDRNGDDRIDITEFLQLVKERELEAIMTTFGEISDMQQNQPNQIGDHQQQQQQVQPLGVDDNDAENANDNPDLVTSIVTQLSQEEIDMLRDCFIKLDQNGDGFIDKEEMFNGVRPVVKDRFESSKLYLEKIFDVADKDGDGMLSLTEFLASFADGPGAVPHEVVMDCVSKVRIRLTDEEISHLQEVFHNIDQNADGFIDRDELLASLKGLLQNKFPDLTDQSFNDIVTVVLATADSDRDGKLNLAEFIRSFQEDQGVLPSHFITDRASHVKRKLTRDEVEALKEAFSALDENADGFIDYKELYVAVSQVLERSMESPDDVRLLADQIMLTADRNKDGRLTLTEFIRNFAENSELMEAPLVAAAERIAAAQQRMAALVESGDVYKMVKLFHFLDANEDGYLSKNELQALLFRTFTEWYPEWEDDKINQMIGILYDAADVNKDGLISIEEFISTYVKGYGIIPIDAVREIAAQLRRRLSRQELQVIQESFQRWDKNGDGFVSKDELREAFHANLSGLGLEPAVISEITEAVMALTDRSGDGRLSLKEFILSFELDEDVLPVSEEAQVHAATQQQEQTEAQAGTERHEDPMSARQQQEQAATQQQQQEEAAPVAAAEEMPSVARQLQPDDVAQPQSAAAAVQQTPAAKEQSSAARAEEDDARSPIHNDVSGAMISDGQLRKEFKKFDKDGSGRLSKEEFKSAYLALEFFGLPPSNREFEALWKRFLGDKQELGYDAFCMFMLHKSRM